MESILSMEFLNNSLKNWAIAVGFVVSTMIVGKIVQAILSGWLKMVAEKTKSSLDDFLILMFSQIKWEWFVIGIFAASRFLTFSGGFDKAMVWFVAIVLLNRVIRMLSATMDYAAEKLYFRKEDVDSGSKGAIKHIVFLLKIAVAGVLIVITLDNLGFNIGALVAGLGVGGIIIGLAVQNIVGDLFSSFCIIFDRPFEVGDFIIVDNYMGVVSHVGIKTTRLISLGGEQIVFSNSDLTGSRIRNYKRMEKRRIAFGFGIEYGTAEDKLKRVSEMVKEIVANIKDATFDRAHFQKFGNSSLDFEVVYYVLSSDYNKYMDIQEKINLALFARFSEEGINFAFPTQTLHVKECNVTQSN